MFRWICLFLHHLFQLFVQLVRSLTAGFVRFKRFATLHVKSPLVEKKADHVKTTDRKSDHFLRPQPRSFIPPLRLDAVLGQLTELDRQRCEARFQRKTKAERLWSRRDAAEPLERRKRPFLLAATVFSMGDICSMLQL